MRGIWPDPTFLDVIYRERVEVVPTFPATPFDNHKARFFKHREMLHHRAAIHIRHHRAERAGRLRLILDHINNPAPHTMAERLEQRIIFIFI